MTLVRAEDPDDHQTTPTTNQFQAVEIDGETRPPHPGSFMQYPLSVTSFIARGDDVLVRCIYRVLLHNSLNSSRSSFITRIHLIRSRQFS